MSEQRIRTFVEDKIEHLIRVGLVARNRRTGRGMNGGAAPDWLVEEQEADARRRNRQRALRAA